MLGPAVALTLAAPRLGGGARAAGGPLEEDPPSLTFRRGHAGPQESGASGAGARRGVPPRARRASRLPRRTAFQPGQRPEATVPEIHWHRATSHGLPYAGFLTAGTRLPGRRAGLGDLEPGGGRGRLCPNEPRRLYGNEHTIRTVVSVLAAYRAANPDAPRVVVGDISFRGGGPMEEHRSHQNGLDVNLYYPRLDRVLRAPVATQQIDRTLAQDLLDRFVAAGAEMVFVGYSTGLHGPAGVVVPYANHGNHMHVRFPPPPG